MGEQAIRYLCRQQYLDEGSVECPDKFTQDSCERIWWAGEVFKIAREEIRSNGC